ncbi:protein MAIN-LIKE 1-like [Medicago truncatula]|uniref:protein MAIN-LIKE 1-like n=1 Tax=Medicago truncatula TaxID=3880 RepID=UPI001968330A|nr:protein MAIN-LIKE 1-like [Medicago truncatula]
MADQDPIDPSKMIGGRRAMTQSHRRERQGGHIPKRGRGRRGDGSGSSQATQPEESQVVDPSQPVDQTGVEYLNYQDQVHHDVTDGGYDQDHIPQQQDAVDEDDIAAAAAPKVLPTDPPFPGGPEDLSLLHSYADHVALSLWYNSNNVRKTRVLKPINHGAKILTLGRPNANENWFWDALQQSGLHDLVYLGYSTVPHALLLTLCERWHPETSTFHMPMGEMTVTLDDVACLTHLPIEGRMLAHGKKMPKYEGAELLMTYLGVSQNEAQKICNQEYGGYISYPRLREFYTSYLGRANVLAGTEDAEELEELARVRTYCVRCYLLYLVGCLLFGDRSNKRIELIYLTTMADGYAGMRNYSWGAMTLTYLYGELADACRPGHRALGGSVTLLTAWFLAHFPGFFSVDLNTDYLENYPVAARLL